MTRFSARFSVAITVVAVLALAPIGYVRLAPDRDECADEAAFLNGPAIDPRTILVMEGERATDLSKSRLTGTIPTKKGQALTVYTVTRSYGLLPRLLQPVSALPGSFEPDVVERAELDVEGGRLAFHYTYEQGTLLRLTAYFMTYRLRGIESPFWTLIADSPAVLAEGRWPITLFVVATQTSPAGRKDAERRIEDWIRAAWGHYQATCGG